MDIEENDTATSAGEPCVKWKAEEDNSSVTAEQPNPFDDPVQRTKCLIQYIRLRKQRAEAEQAKRNAIKKQKITARATLQNAREEKAAAEAEELQCAVKIEALNQEKHQVLAALKAIHSRETERKRKREEQERQRRALAEEQRRREEQRRMAAQQPQHQQQQSLAAIEYLLQLKNAQHALTAIIASATGEGSQLGTPQAMAGHPLASALPPSILSLLMQNALPDVTGSAPQSVQIGGAASSLPLTANSFANFPTATHNQQQRMAPPTHNQSSSATNATNPQQHSSQQHQMHLQQQQQVQSAVAQLLRQQFPTNAPGIIGMNALLNAAGISGGQAQIGTNFSNIGNFPVHQHPFDLQTLAAAAHNQTPQQQQQQLASALNLQALVGSAVGGTVHQSPIPITSTTTSNNIPGIPQDLLFQATLLAAANLSNPGLNSAQQQQQQQRPK